MHDPIDFDRVAERFDELYTRMTVLQRELVAARREGVSDARARELASRAVTFLAAYRTTESAMGVGRMDVRAAEAAALRERVLIAPVDEHLLMAVLRAQGRGYAFALLADALAEAAADGALAVAVGARSVRELLAAPRGMGAGRLTGWPSIWAWTQNGQSLTSRPPNCSG